MHRNRSPHTIGRDARGRTFPVIPENPGPMKPGNDVELIERYEKKGNKAYKRYDKDGNPIIKGGLTKGYLKYWSKKESQRQKEIAKKRKAVKRA